MDEASLRELPAIEKRTGYLAMLGNLATLAGLLGTIGGLIKSFAGVAGVDPSQKATAAVEGHLRGHELHVLRPAHRHHRPGRLRLAERQDPERSSTTSSELKKSVANLVMSAKAALRG